MTMLTMLFLLIPAVALAVADLVPAIRAGGRKAPAAYIAGSAAAVALWLCVACGVKLTGPSEIVMEALKALLPPIQ